MKTLIFTALVLNFLSGTSQQTLQEKLGYSKDSKLLIIHADDLGMSHSENEASIYALENGSVSSASIMVPCPWFPEIAAYVRAHPKADFGLHLTFTSEWKYFKWGPITAKEKVPGLVNKYGFMFESVDSVQKSSKPGEVEMEIRAQFERAKEYGIDITHLDSHMGTLFSKKEYLEALVKLGREYKIPVMLNKQIVSGMPANLHNAKDVLMEMIYVESPPDFKSGTENYYAGVFKSLQAGVNIILLHAAYDDREMQAITIDHADYGAAWRQADFNFFTSENCKKLLKENNIQVVTWREIRDKLLR